MEWWWIKSERILPCSCTQDSYSNGETNLGMWWETKTKKSLFVWVDILTLKSKHRAWKHVARIINT